ncbi:MULTISPECIES: acyl-CoA dehydrogenase family protein [Corynebacterium]|uniref:acyl-CoA dehydrogenase family protein n=1 Tax=Corynebacterium TaxID=1716 RepID=UPI00124F69F9|nr:MULTISPECIES: acyl-CoA dehydrogenase family protein [Corynebacterium]
MSIPLAPTATTAVSEQLLDQISSTAHSVDTGATQARYALPLLAAEGALDLGLATNADGQFGEQVRVIRALAERDLSVAFASWAHRMAAEYLSVAETPTSYLEELAATLRSGSAPGVTGMASVMKTAAGCGHVDLSATAVEGGYRVSGRIPWASNLADDSIIVTGAALADAALIFAVRASDEGVELAAPFELLGLNSTASAGLTLNEVFIPTEAVISTDLAGFARRIRPTFALLQISECLGLAQASITAATSRLHGVHATFESEQEETAHRIEQLIATQDELAARVGRSPIAPSELLQLRLDAAEVATAAAGIEVRVAGGAGYGKNSPVSRRFREAAFIPVQSPSEAQLRWELARAHEKERAA